MSNLIKTPEEMRKEQVWVQIKKILKDNQLNLFPKVTMTLSGMAFEIDLVPAAAQLQGLGGKADG